jgi:hypothetical protein
MDNHEELRARVEALEAQGNHIPDATKKVPVATEGNKKPAIINAVVDGDPPAPHKNWEDWILEVFKTSTIKGVRLRAIVPGDFSFDEEEATPPPVATDEELRKIYNAPTLSYLGGLRAIYSLGIKHGQAGNQEVADPAPVAGGLVERVKLSIDIALYDEDDHQWNEARAAILEVATWLREQGAECPADLLEQEAGR